ncbi:MAG: DNA mismatch repair endonuclease MutL, partial [Ruminococcus sp.]|nr:DNA mismatch repair endonuclease MutL [Ruminococcus sp.]
KPLYSKNSRAFQNFFVNGRYIKSLTCCAALEEGYKNNIMVGKFPACVLNIHIAPEVVDVNVHPTKTEVRFSDNKPIYEAVYFAVKNTLLQFDKPNEIKFNSQRVFSDKELYDFPNKESQNDQLQFDTTVEDKIDTHSDEDIVAPESFQHGITVNVEKNSVSEHNIESKSIFNETKQAVNEEKTQFVENVSDYKYITQNAFEKKESVVTEKTETIKQKPVVIGELFKTYIVAQVDDDMLLFDKHAAHERYIFEQIKNDASQLDTQMYLEPVMVLLSYKEYDALNNNLDKISELGFSIEPDVAPTVAVKGVPMVLSEENPSDIIAELADNFIQCRHNPQLEIFDELFHSIACKAAIKANDNSSLIELQALVNAVYDDNAIRYCPHGRPVMIKLSKKDIEKQFKRIV